VHETIPFGGSTRIPRIVKLSDDYFDASGKEPNKMINLDELQAERCSSPGRYPFRENLAANSYNSNIIVLSPSNPIGVHRPSPSGSRSFFLHIVLYCTTFDMSVPSFTVQ
jgi:hypothetical protein